MGNSQVEVLKSSLSEISELAVQNPYSAAYQVWNTRTMKLLQNLLDPEMADIFSRIPLTQNYASRIENQRCYLRHLEAKKDALENLIRVIENGASSQNSQLSSSDNESIEEAQSVVQRDPDQKKRTRTAKLGFNIGILQGEIGEEREL